MFHLRNRSFGSVVYRDSVANCGSYYFDVHGNDHRDANCDEQRDAHCYKQWHW